MQRRYDASFYQQNIVREYITSENQIQYRILELLLQYLDWAVIGALIPNAKTTWGTNCIYVNEKRL